ncbi:MCP four helix bundle domain-containing protein [Deefgea piscis]|uniref:MCP four helix bundle domain-containing protein n=1 Tax=Deefgea piscis TaxID=2739061 RepID=A0A6M8SSH0_9NEIS|nr:methyl-accepting chemotaxis protein [Deefgea piscis]QKJ66380.1 MCP four helix bundle domain-containing protein [Deefgea piscis]
MQISIQQRLIYTVLFLSLILMTLGGMGLYNLQQVNQSLKTVYEDRVVPLKQLKIIADAYAVNIIDAANKAQVGLLNAENTTQQVAAAQQIIAQQWQAYKATTLTADESRLAQTAEQRFAVANQKIMLLKQFLAQQQGPIQGQLTQQIGILYPAIDPVGEIIGDLMNLQLDVAKAEYLQAQTNYQQVKILTIGLILFGLCLAALSCFLLIRAISIPLSRAVGIAENIAQGRLENTIEIHSQDETGRLLQSMQNMQLTIQGFVHSQTEMAKQHRAGWTSHRMDPAAFPGTFGEMAAETNQLVQSHILVTEQTVQVIAQYAQGNFEVAMPRLNGDQAQITQAIDQVKQALLNISNEINTLAEASAAGDFSVRGDAQRYQFKFKAMIDDLNRLINTCDIGFNDILRVANALSVGDLSQTIQKEYPGLFGKAKDGVNHTVFALSSIVAEIESMVTAAAEHGNFSLRLDVKDKTGFSARIAHLLNRLSEVTEMGLRDVMQVASALAQGDLSQTIRRDYPGLLGETKEGINATVYKLQQLVGEIQRAGSTIHVAATEIAQGNQDLSRRTEAQAASLEETASSSEELASTVKQNADNAITARQLAQNAEQIAKTGSGLVQSIVTSMASINASSGKIVDIISVIDGIAFQTNILALNAAVEAARAGEQGRGFAVVATEVRHLAQRSAIAAKEIKVLINGSVDEVARGSQIVSSAGSTMTEIEQSIQRVTHLMHDIAIASKEQSDGIGQVNQAVGQMDEVTQQNAALVEEAAAAATSLQEQADQLAQLVGVFKLNPLTPRLARSASEVY